MRRLFKGYKRLGAESLLSKKRGRPSNHQLPEGVKGWATALLREHYVDFGPTLSRDKLV
jgi:hypothetical protein